jgi:hypothetical protein
MNSMSPNVQETFWERMGLQEEDRNTCVSAIEKTYPGADIESYANQGYCSFTFLVTSSPKELAQGVSTDHSTRTSAPCIVQIRPPQHWLDRSITSAAQKTYGSLTPRVRDLQCSLPGALMAVEMDLKRGVALSQLLLRRDLIDTHTKAKQVRLVESLASFTAQAWPNCTTETRRRCMRADSPLSDGPSWLARCTGKVGANMIPKLVKLIRDLPDPLLRERARDTLDSLMSIVDYPVVVNHGDLIPTNILVDKETWEITGIVDWAEAEWLPFGMSLYGLDHCLGFLEHSSSTPVFRYHQGANDLKKTFWRKLVEVKPGVKERLESVRAIRDVGVFLWLGYAWDDGKIDRVVNEVDDAEDLARLRSFLDIRKQ